ncbi:alpha-glucosidase [Lacticaseibacillus baoqingensis]|uniref:Alpha-glucosidase n=1 Tax=Lacticaseibacillus baoqingensis TaxID=2486013 RepID=A0ABW4E6J1_9LACO|nr:alpha-glucosidase [Lacticaseibacillus baoqingensis]
MAWYEKAIIYQIYPKSFNDSNGDGIGDLEGIRQQVPYLQALGINTVWLNPVFVSPQVDNGYDVANYYAIDPSMGTMADMTRLIADLHAAGIRVLLDFVLNHTSDQHPWFQDALQSRDSLYRDYYIFAGEKGQRPNNWGSFFGGSAWTVAPDASGQSYLHLFDDKMPDLNWRNPNLRYAMGDVAAFWLDKGIDGLRLDAFIHVAKADLGQDFPASDDQPVLAEPFIANLPAVKQWLRPLVSRIKSDYPETFLLGEAASADVAQAAAYTDPASGLLDSVISFRMFADDEQALDSRLPALYQPKPIAPLAFKQTQVQWQQGLGKTLPVLYWNNHDMARVATRYGHHDPTASKSLAMLMYLQRGTPLLYYGEELGLQNLDLPAAAYAADPSVAAFLDQAQAVGYSEAEALAMVNATHKFAARGPMPWDESVHHGFSQQTPWLQGQHPAATSVAQQTGAADSVLAFYRQLLQLKQTPLFTTGKERLLKSPAMVYLYSRTLKAQKALVAVNLGAAPVTLSVTGKQVILAAGDVKHSAHQLTLGAYAGAVVTK